MSAFPNFFQHPLAYNQVRLGGRLLKATLKEIDGIKIEDEWSEQKPTGSSGATWVFKGTKPAGPHKCVFICGNSGKWTAAQCYDDLMDVYEMMAPQPGFSGSSTTGATSGSANTPTAYTQGQSGNAGTTAASTSALNSVNADANEGDKSKGSGANPGPRPPTLSIENAFMHRLGTTAVSRKSFEMKPSSNKDTIEVTIEFVPQKAPVPAGTGVAPAKTPDAASQGQQFQSAGGASNSAAGADKAAAQAGAGT